MKISANAYSILVSIIAELPKEKVLEHKAKRLGTDIQKRFVWDMFHAAAKVSRKYETDLYSLLYDRNKENLNDTHIETAMKKALAELGYL
jgi:hypothetical protein